MRVRERSTAGAGWIVPVILVAGTVFTVAGAPEPVAAAKREARENRREGRDFHWSGHVARGNRVQINGVNGEIVAVGVGGSEVEVVAVKTARRSDPDDVKIEVTEHEGGVTICALYPNRSGGYGDCDAEGSHQNTKNNDVRVDFRVRVPAGVRFVGRTVNGKVQAERLSGPVEASTVNGSVVIATDDIGEASTVNGSISASLGVSRWSNELEFSTVNGSITVDFPSDLSTALHASTVNGTISTDFPMTVQGKFSRRSISGNVGRGRGGELSLSTVNGSINLRSGSAH